MPPKSAAPRPEAGHVLNPKLTPKEARILAASPPKKGAKPPKSA